MQPLGLLSSPQHSVAWLVGLCGLAALLLLFLLARVRARRLAASSAALEAIARALVSGAQAEVPARLEVRELEAAAQALAHAANVVRAREFALRSADRVKDEFLAMLAHELRNPLSAVAAAAYLLRSAAKDAQGAQAAELIERQVQHMTRLIEDLLDIARLTRGKVSLSRQPLDFAALVRKGVGEMQLAGRLAEHSLRLDVAEAWVLGDEARLQQLVANLVGNAVKYTPAGGRIAVTVRRDRDAAILRVQDSGVGMSPELAARAFDLFVQGEVSVRRGGGGLGIGLCLVKQLAELHGGKSFAASPGPGEGSVFTVSLPAIEAQARSELPPDERPAPARHRILLVEDDADMRNSMFAALALHGHRVYEAADGPSALRAAQAVKPDVALIDIGLPKEDGFEMASALRGNPAREGMILIAMTGADRAETARRAREAGFDGTVAKPIAPDRLERLIDAAFVSRARRASAALRPPDGNFRGRPGH